MADIADPYEPSNPNCLLRPEPAALNAYELNKAQYVRGLGQMAEERYQPALDTFTSVFYNLKGKGGGEGFTRVHWIGLDRVGSSATFPTESDDQACLNLVMFTLTNACQAKLHLRQLQTCTTLCNFLIGKATGVPPLRRLLDRLIAIRDHSDATMVCEQQG